MLAVLGTREPVFDCIGVLNTGMGSILLSLGVYIFKNPWDIPYILTQWKGVGWFNSTLL